MWHLRVTACDWTLTFTIGECERVSEREVSGVKAVTFCRHYQLPDFVSVFVPNEDGGDANGRHVIVEIINKPISKPFLGGFINRKTRE